MLTVSCLGIAVLGLALGLPFWRLPRAVAAFLTLPGDHALPRIQDGGAGIPAQLRALWHLGSERVESARFYTDLGLAELILAEMGDRDPAMLDQAITPCAPGHARRASGASPRLDPLSYAELLANGLSEKAAPALEMARVTAPTAWPTVPPPELCFFSFWPFLSESSKAAAPRSTSLAPRSKAPPPNHRPHQLGREHVDRRSRAPVKRRYAQPADDSAPPRFPLDCVSPLGSTRALVPPPVPPYPDLVRRMSA
jgi:hypothetical protein